MYNYCRHIHHIECVQKLYQVSLAISPQQHLSDQHWIQAMSRARQNSLQAMNCLVAALSDI
jgi:predicted DNA-binding protein (MmcQ/YjbR family)